jgi:hypothetical protein
MLRYAALFPPQQEPERGEPRREGGRKKEERGREKEHR